MAQRKPEESDTLDQVLRLVTQLTPEEQEILSAEFLKLQQLRSKCAESEASLDRGQGISAEVVFDELEAEYQRRKTND